MRLLGKRIMDFNDRSEGGRVKGVKIFFWYKDARVEGRSCDSQFFRSDSPFYDLVCNLPINCEFKLEYAPKGGIIDVFLVTDISDDLFAVPDVLVKENADLKKRLEELSSKPSGKS